MPGYKDILKKSAFQDVLEAYQKQMEYWTDGYLTAEEVFQQRRAFVNAYREELEDMGNYLFSNTDLQTERLKAASRDGILEMMKDYQYLKLDEEIERTINGTKQERNMMEHARAVTAKAEFRSSLMSDGFETLAAAEKRREMSGTKADALSDPTLTDEQRKGLRDFHQWLYRNCDKSGFEVFGSAGSIRDFANEFVKKPVDVQLKTLYLLETNRRKLGADQQTLKDDLHSQTSYVPDLSKIKKRMVATKWKFWRRTDGSQMYWHKLTESLKQAEQSKDMTQMIREGIRVIYQESADVQAFRKEQKDAFRNLGDPEPHIKGGTKAESTKETMASVTKTVNEGFSQYKNATAANGLALGLKKLVDDMEKIRSGILPENARGKSPMSFIQEELKSVKPAFFAQEGVVLGAVSVASGIGSIGAGVIKVINLAETGGLTRTVANVKQGVDLIGDAGKTAKSISTAVAGFAKAGSTTAVQATTAAGVLGAVGFGIATVANGLEVIEKSKNLGHVDKAESKISQLSGASAEQKMQMQKEAHVLRRLNESAKTSAVKDAAVNGTCAALTAAGLAVPGLSVLTLPTVAVIQTGHRIASSVEGAKRRKDNVQMVTETLGDDQRTRREKIADYERRQAEKESMYPEGSKERKRIHKLRSASEYPEQALHKVYRKLAVEHGSEHMTSYADKKLNQVAERMIRHIYLVDPEKGMTADNVMSPEQQKKALAGKDPKETGDKKIRRTSYKELFGGTGAKVKPIDPRKETDMQKALQERQSDVKKKLSGMMKK